MEVIQLEPSYSTGQIPASLKACLTALLEGIRANLRKILGKGLYVVFWLERPDCIHNRILLVSLPQTETANI